MKLNSLEFMLMNNPVRAALQARVETPAMIGPGEPLVGLRVLEVGCGRGVGVSILLARGAAYVKAFDIDPRMITQAKHRLARNTGRCDVYVGDAEHINERDGEFAAVVDYGILHHVPHWEQALREIARVLKPGGVFYFEDILTGFTSARLAQAVFDHPQVSQFSSGQFRGGIEAAGLRVMAWRQVREWGVMGRARKG